MRSVGGRPVFPLGAARGWSLGPLGGHRPSLGGARGSSLGALGGLHRPSLGGLVGAHGWMLGAVGLVQRLPVFVVRDVSFCSPGVMGGVSPLLFKVCDASSGCMEALEWSPGIYLGALEWASICVLCAMGRSAFGVLG